MPTGGVTDVPGRAAEPGVWFLESVGVANTYPIAALGSVQNAVFAGKIRWVMVSGPVGGEVPAKAGFAGLTLGPLVSSRGIRRIRASALWSAIASARNKLQLLGIA